MEDYPEASRPWPAASANPERDAVVAANVEYPPRIEARPLSQGGNWKRPVWSARTVPDEPRLAPVEEVPVETVPEAATAAVRVPRRFPDAIDPTMPWPVFVNAPDDLDGICPPNKEETTRAVAMLPDVENANGPGPTRIPPRPFLGFDVNGNANERRQLPQKEGKLTRLPLP